jgi:hypothetical protein
MDIQRPDNARTKKIRRIVYPSLFLRPSGHLIMEPLRTPAALLGAVSPGPSQGNALCGSSHSIGNFLGTLASNLMASLCVSEE